MIDEKNTATTPEAQPAAPPAGEGKESGPPPEPPTPDTRNREIQEGFGPFALRPEERSHFEKLAQEAEDFAAQPDWETVKRQCPVYGSDIADLTLALTNTAKALKRAMEGYRVLDADYAALNAEAQLLMNTVRQDQDRQTGKRGAGGRFTPPEEIAPPPLPGTVYYDPRVDDTGKMRDPRPERAYDLQAKADKAGYLADALQVSERENEKLHRAFRRFILKTAGLAVEDWEIFT